MQLGITAVTEASARPPTSEQPVSTDERGMLLMTAAVIVAPGIHAIAKGLGDTLPPGEIAWARFFLQVVFLLPFVWFRHRGRVPPPSLTHFVRGLLVASAVLSFFWGLTYLPLADSSAIFFVEPLILTVLAALFLGEPIGWRRVLAVIVGFVGALLVIRPSFETIGPAALLPLLAAFCFAFYLTITRGLAAKEDGLAMQFWVSGFAAIALSVALAVGSQTSWPVVQPAWPAGGEWGLLLALGVVATVSHMLAILAFRRAPASVLAPFQYLEILGATVLGVVFFADLPDGLTTLGILIIVGSGLYVFHRERIAARGAGEQST